MSDNNNDEKVNNNEVSKEELEKLKKDALDSVNFVEKIEKINLDFDKYVIFTDGDIQLVYENGEFFVVSSTDIYSKKEKKEKEVEIKDKEPEKIKTKEKVKDEEDKMLEI